MFVRIGVLSAPTDPWLKAMKVEKRFVIFSAALSLLALAGLVLATIKYGAGAAPLSLSLLLFPAIYYVTHSAVRYRHPVDSLLCIFTAFAVASAWSAVTSRLRRGAQLRAAS